MKRSCRHDASARGMDDVFLSDKERKKLELALRNSLVEQVWWCPGLGSFPVRPWWPLAGRPVGLSNTVDVACHAADRACCLVRGQSARDEYAVDFDACVTLYPTLEEFSNPVTFLEATLRYSDKYGIVKVVPPDGWRPPVVPQDLSLMFETKLQRINRLQVRHGSTY